MTSTPPRGAVWLIELFIARVSAEPVFGDLAEEFAVRTGGSGHAARRWYWRQAVSTILHLAWASIQAAPWSTAALVLGGLVLAAVADRAVNGAASLLLASVNAYDYVSAVWFWRAIDATRFVVVPLALGWSCAVIARDREMVIAALIAGVLIAVLAWNVGVLIHHLVPPGPLLGSPGGRRFLYEVVQMGTTFPAVVVAGGMLRRTQQMRAARIAM